MSVTKRFIAGAVCPRCAAMDRIVTFSTDEGHFRECVSCDFSERLPDPEETAAATAELATRVNQAPRKPAPDTQPLKFFKKPPKKDGGA